MSSKKPSLKTNYEFNLLVKIVNLLYPIITIPYVTRILGPEGFGKTSFALAFANYFILLANFGVGTNYAIREISKVRNDPIEMKRVFSELFLLFTFSSFLASILYITTFFFVEKVKQDLLLYLVVGISLFLNQMAVGWFFTGIENFKYLAIRNFLVKVIVILAILITVREPKDYTIYAFVVSFSVFGLNILDFAFALRHTKLQLSSSFLRHLASMLMFFLIGIFSILNTGIDVILLGFLETTNPDKAVGLFSAVRKVILILLIMVNSLISVNYSRLTHVLSQNSKEEYINLLKKTSNSITFISFFAFSITFSFSREIMEIIGGSKFIEAELSLKIMSLLLITNVLKSIIEFQILNPNNGERLVTIGSVISWVITFVMLILLVPTASYLGASISLLIGDITTLLIFLVLSTKILPTNVLKTLFLSKNTLLHLFVSISIVLLHTLISQFLPLKPTTIIEIIAFTGILGGLYSLVYFTTLLLLRDETAREIKETLLKLALRLIDRKT
ncbi:MAG: oligosaccharide flippase family protein [Brevinematia bacterium]